MRECICGKAIPRRKEKGHREREYCSDKCRQRAYRARTKGKREAWERTKQSRERDMLLWEKIQTELANSCIDSDFQRIADNVAMRIEIDIKNRTIAAQDHIIDMYKEHEEKENVSERFLKNLLAEKDAEIARLNALLDAMSKKKR